MRGFKEKCIEAGLGDVLLYIGGILGVSRHDFEEDVVKFKALGFDRSTRRKRISMPPSRICGGSPGQEQALSGRKGTMNGIRILLILAAPFQDGGL